MSESAQPMTFDRRDPRPYPCADHDRRISLTEQSVASLKQTNEGITTKLDLILAQVTRVALLEEKHTSLVTDNNRVHNKIAGLEKDIEKLGLESREFINYTKGQDKVLWGICAAFAALFTKVLFFAAGNGMTH